MKKLFIKNAGFTLIETIIYLGLFGLIIGGGMVATYQIIQGSQQTNNQVIVNEEATFLLQKINWALAGAANITTPTSSTAATNLSLTKIIAGTPTILTFEINADDASCPVNSLCLKRPAMSVEPLNSSSISVTNMSFLRQPAANGKPDAITASFTLTALQAGEIESQNFSTTKYLRQ